MVIFLLVLIGGISYYAFSKPEVKAKFMFNANRVYYGKEYYRLLTSGFIHGDWFHLGFNLYALHLFSKTLIQSFTQVGLVNPELHFLILFVLGVVVSEIPSLLKHKDNPYYNSLGASGGVSSVVFGSILLNPVGMKLGLVFLPIYLPAFLFGILYLLYSNYQSKKGTDNIGHDAHIFGSLFGLIYVAAIYPNSLIDIMEQLKNWDGNIF